MVAFSEVTHSDIARALAQLGERCGPVEVAQAIEAEWEPFEAQMRRRMRSRPRRNRDAYRILARAGQEKVRLHLEARGRLPRRQPRHPRRLGIVARVRRSLGRHG